MRDARTAERPVGLGLRRILALASIHETALVLSCLVCSAMTAFASAAEPGIVTLKPIGFKMVKGSISGKEVLASLASNDSTSYLEISPGRTDSFLATFEFRYNGDASKVKKLDVRINSNGEAWDAQRRQFQIRAKRDPNAPPETSHRGGERRKGRKKFRWIKIGDNREATSWEWQSLEWSEEGPKTDLNMFFTYSGGMRIRVMSNNAVNAMHLDYLEVDLHVDAAPPQPGGWWVPSANAGLTWQWQLTGEINMKYDVDMYDVDLFDVSTKTIKDLQDDGRIVICYFSGGSYEHWRPDWPDFFPEGEESMPLAGKMEMWDENYLDLTKMEQLKPIMTSRLKLAKQKGCDGVEPDNMDAYTNPDETGKSFTYNQQLTYNRWMANKAHEFGLSVALKNDVDQLEDLVDYFDFAVNEECFQYRECGKYKVFTSANKAVFGTEYKGDPRQFCPQAQKMKLSVLKKKLDLGVWRIGCEDFFRGGGGGGGGGEARWLPRASDHLTWQWQLSGKVDMQYDVDVYDIDLFDAPVETIKALKDAGRKVVCYFSAGTYEDWRPDWEEYFPKRKDLKAILAGDMADWDEAWLDIRRIEELKPIMTGRMEMARDKGCDAVEPDNVDAFSNKETGLPLKASDQLAYNFWIADKAHELGLSVAFKNNVEQIPDSVDRFDFAINEQCHEYNECKEYALFIERDKAVLGVEYNGNTENFCPKAEKYGLSFMKKRWDLNSWRDPC